MWRQMPFAAASPFHHSRGQESGYVLAFEVELHSICGLDYSNPLILDGRMVIEANHVVKREFLTMKDAKDFYRPAGVPAGAWLSQQGPPSWPGPPLGSSPPGRGASALSSTASTPAMSPEPRVAAQPGRAAPGASRRELSQHFSQSGMPATVLAGSLHAASDQLQQGRQPPKEQRLTGQSMAAGASAAGLGRLHAGSLPVQRPSGSAMPSMNGMLSMGRGAGQDGHSGKRQKTSDSEDEMGSFSARQASSARPGQASAAENGAPAEAWISEQSTGNQQRDPPVQRESADMVSLAEPTAGSSSGGPPVAMVSPQRMPQSHREAQHAATTTADRRAFSEPKVRPPRLKAVPELSAPQDGCFGSRAASAARLLSSIGSKHQVTGMKHSRSGSFESNGYAEPQKQTLLGDPLIWPSPSSWTVPSRAYEYRTVSFNFSDPRVPQILQHPIQSNERLLKLYESGLPAWAIYMPLYRLPYRPWMRKATYCLFILISVFSLVVGYYDIIKNVPLFRKALSSIVGSLSLPSAAILEWLDSHVQVRMSILFAYMFGKSQLFAQLLTWLAQTWAPVWAALDPLFLVLGPPLLTVTKLLRTTGAALSLVARDWGAFLGSAVSGTFGPPLQAFLSAARAVKDFVVPILKVAKLAITGPVTAVISGVRYAASCTQVFGTTVLAGARVAPSMQATAMEASSQASWWYLVPADAVELVRVSSLKTVKALQTVARFFAQVCTDIARHRLTLRLQFLRRWEAFKSSLAPYIGPPLEEASYGLVLPGDYAHLDGQQQLELPEMGQYSEHDLRLLQGLECHSQHAWETDMGEGGIEHVSTEADATAEQTESWKHAKAE
ncbi:g756 [Coccomyxa viridis]|uniref:G756 protein n=1 Tax=Coccomyxa viridis TaxID=1274662 RepID=A0ABP1FGM1_9CHLO